MPYPSKIDREVVLATAMQQATQDGLKNLSLRSVAAALEVAPNALYRYFGDRTALEAALADESVRRLHAHLRRAAGRKAPESSIRSVALAYIQFAREHPAVFEMTMQPCTPEQTSDPAHAELWRFVLDLVMPLYGEARAPEAAVALWAFLHGMTSLESAGVFGTLKPRSSFEFGLRIWMEAAADECHVKPASRRA